jgi:hypothetical protein
MGFEWSSWHNKAAGLGEFWAEGDTVAPLGTDLKGGEMAQRHRGRFREEPDLSAKTQMGNTLAAHWQMPSRR